ncbi:MAG: hypothetical protein KDD45_06590 [Bdellovibrionales bacterium]|nr:hypothetical protein [Bdellovibrionales bacterium]
MSKRYNLFSVFGIESEYMIVEKSSLKNQPIADKVLQELNKGVICNEVDLGKISCSNELVNHLLEIKSTHPEKSINNLDATYHNSVMEINEVLNKWNCCLMPTSMNPWFNPLNETVLWPHDHNEIYNLYDQIFNCKGHGWSNIQSVHLNLPFQNETEFVKLHSAIRIILPLIPFFAASSPFYDSKKQSLADNRLAFYELNQAKVPSIIGNIIPENVKSFSEYDRILEKIYKDISPYDPNKILQNSWLNSRAAIPKFDVFAIEIRLMDIQESPYMDFTLINLFVEMIKFIIEQDSLSKNFDMFTDNYLRTIYDQSKEFTPISDLKNYFNLFDIKTKDVTFNNLRSQIIDKFLHLIAAKYHKGLDILKCHGSLSQRLVETELTVDKYKKLISCLNNNIPYEN